ncbi:MAG TPA: hypothetical protein VFQ38_11670 [Longimicrobiales bacterium]|nr:hypothetical protein [Longimicrobiales bacterium]
MRSLPLVLLSLLGLLAVALGLGFWLARSRRRANRQRYGKFLEEAVADGMLSQEELAQLQVLRDEGDISDAEARMVAVSVYRRALKQAMADSRVTQEEETTLHQVQQELGLTEADLRADRDNLRRMQLLARLERGQLPDVESPVGLLPGEHGHWVVHATLCERLALPAGPASGPPGQLFEVADTEPFHVTGRRGPLARSPLILPMDLGILVVTSGGLRFQGAKVQLQFPHERLRRIALFADGLRVDYADPARSHYFLLTDPELTAAVLLLAARRASGAAVPGRTA